MTRRSVHVVVAVDYRNSALAMGQPYLQQLLHSRLVLMSTERYKRPRNHPLPIPPPLVPRFQRGQKSISDAVPPKRNQFAHNNLHVASRQFPHGGCFCGRVRIYHCAFPTRRRGCKKLLGQRSPKIHRLHRSGTWSSAAALRRFLSARGTEPCMQVTALPGLNGKLRNQCLHLLYKICKDREVLPTSYLLQQESIHTDTLHRSGGFADVSKGEYLGRCVAIKDLRFGTRDGSNRIFKVLNSSTTGYFTVAHFLNSSSAGKS